MDTQKLDAYFKALEENQKFMGNVALSQNGKLIYSHSIGFADIDSNTKLTSDYKFRIGSITKTFTAALLLLAVEEKKIKLSTPLATFFPILKNADKITIQHLLTHRSGIYNFTSKKDYLSWNTHKHSREELIKRILDNENNFEPNEKTEYSNSNYVLLTFILEDIYKKEYTDILQEKISIPLGLKNTYVGDAIRLENKEAHSYQRLENWIKKTQTHLSVPRGAGSIVSTTNDLINFIESLFAHKVVSAESLKTMTNLHEGYGMGLIQFPFGDKLSFGHNGSMDAFTSMLAYFPSEKVSIVILSNSIVNYFNNDIAIALLSAVFDVPYEIPTFTTYIPSLEELNSYLGNYSSEQLPLQINIFLDENTLYAQATG